jgi:hypothetical protein
MEARIFFPRRTFRPNGLSVVTPHKWWRNPAKARPQAALALPGGLLDGDRRRQQVAKRISAFLAAGLYFILS